MKAGDSSKARVTCYVSVKSLGLGIESSDAYNRLANRRAYIDALLVARKFMFIERVRYLMLKFLFTRHRKSLTRRSVEVPRRVCISLDRVHQTFGSCSFDSTIAKSSMRSASPTARLFYMSLGSMRLVMG